MKLKLYILLFFTSLMLSNASLAQYPWLDNYDSTQSIANSILPPNGYRRIEVEKGSFRDWLRNLPLKEGNPPIYLYNGEKKPFQQANYAVIDIDTGDKDLQQCADAVMRLRSEYYYSKGQYDSIAFNFTSGDRFRYNDWLDGLTPAVDGSTVDWKRQEPRENSREVFRKYLEILFTYAGSLSLSRELEKVDSLDSMRIGDVFIAGGLPGHAAIIVDMAEDSEGGRPVFLLAQSYTPAQDMHIIKNPARSNISPWFNQDFEMMLYTFEWTFTKDNLMRFK